MVRPFRARFCRVFITWKALVESSPVVGSSSHKREGFDKSYEVSVWLLCISYSTYLNTDTCPPFLSTTAAFVRMVSDPSICSFFQAQLQNDFFDKLLPLFLVNRRRQSQLRGISQCFSDGQRREEDVLLDNICASNARCIFATIE